MAQFSPEYTSPSLEDGLRARKESNLARDSFPVAGSSTPSPLLDSLSSGVSPFFVQHVSLHPFCGSLVIDVSCV